MKNLIKFLGFLSTFIVPISIMFDTLSLRKSYDYIFPLNILSFFIIIPLFLLFIFGVYRLLKPYYQYGKRTDNSLFMLSIALIGLVEILSLFILILQDFNLNVDLGVIFWYSLSLPVLAGYVGFGFVFTKEVKLKNLKPFDIRYNNNIISDVFFVRIWNSFGFFLYLLGFVLAFLPIFIPFITSFVNILFRMCALKNSDKIY